MSTCQVRDPICCTSKLSCSHVDIQAFSSTFKVWCQVRDPICCTSKLSCSHVDIQVFSISGTIFNVYWAARWAYPSWNVRHGPTLVGTQHHHLISCKHLTSCTFEVWCHVDIHYLVLRNWVVFLLTSMCLWNLVRYSIYIELPGAPTLVGTYAMGLP